MSFTRIKKETKRFGYTVKVKSATTGEKWLSLGKADTRQQALDLAKKYTGAKVHIEGIRLDITEPMPLAKGE